MAVHDFMQPLVIYNTRIYELNQARVVLGPPRLQCDGSQVFRGQDVYGLASQIELAR